MKANQENGFRAQVVEEPTETCAACPPPGVNGDPSHAQQKPTANPRWKEKSRLIFIAAGIVLVLILLAFNGISRRLSPPQKTPAKGRKQPLQVPGTGRAPASMIPVLDTGRPPEMEADADAGMADPDQIGRTATRQAKPSPGVNLGSVPPFDDRQPWQPAPFQPGPQPPDAPRNPPLASESAAIKSERDAMDKASLVFITPHRVSAETQQRQTGGSAATTDFGPGLGPGTRLRARLETAVSTAVRTPVVAIIDYNYEQNGDIVIPAGTKVFGHLEAADRSGYIGLHFDSLMMPDGSSLSLEATATDLQLRPLRGKVEGKHTGKNLFVRSLAGVGEIAATLVGRGSLNQPLSENDLLRERVSNNIGQSSDQAVANLAITEHIVVSVPADTELYVVLQKPAQTKLQNLQAPLSFQTTGQPSIEELRQLMQLQRELSQSAVTKPEPE
jgi:hypothetical protein